MIRDILVPIEEGRQGRIDGELKVGGRMLYAADVPVPDVLHAVALRSPYPHARINAIDTSAAERMPGVRCILVGRDVADLRYGRLVRDVPVLAVEKVRFVGERVAVVAAETRGQADRAATAIQVAYTPLPAVFDPDEALAPDAPAVHEEPWAYAGALSPRGGPRNLQARQVWSGGGDVESALAAAPVRLHDRFTTPAVHQGYIEPHSCTAWVESDGRIQVWASTKSPYRLRAQLAATFGVPEQQVDVHAPAIGGDFGGKGSPMDAPLCVALARRAGRPVRLTMRYAEELTAGNPRHASVITVDAGVSRDGRLEALDVRAVFNVGAYAGFRPRPFLHGAADAGCCYRIPALRIESVLVYTNRVPGGHKRSPGAPQTVFAIESMMDIAARRLAIDPWEFRRRHLLRTGEATPLGEHWPEVRGAETLAAAERAFRPAVPARARPSVRVGRGVAVYARATRLGATSLRLRADAAGRVYADVPMPETGTGSHTMLRAVLARELGMDPARFAVQYVGTADLPYDEGVGGSRVTATAGEAALRAARLLSRRARALAAERFGVPEDTIVPAPGGRWVDSASGRSADLGELAAFAAEREEPLVVAIDLRRPAGDEGHADEAVGFCAQVAQVGVDVETGQVFVYEILTVHDIATVLNPRSHRGQIEGGVVMGLGEALTEDLGIREGKVEAAHLGDYKIPSMRDVPPIRVAYLTGGRGVGANNIKAIGEMSNVPVLAALANAVDDAVGVRIRSLPLSAEKIYVALRERDSGVG
ncbi:MAG TPA: xanthine dehydrogenase family protein molybdopterin-binding subunit [bacterium]|nr:xanthine dehydrogenase family protein molybdopterin-binding subunit [bacterium]